MYVYNYDMQVLISHRIVLNIYVCMTLAYKKLYPKDKLT